MVVEGRFRSAETLASERLEKALGSRSLPNATSIASALATALAVDARINGGSDPLTTVLGLAVEDIVELAVDLENALASDAVGFTLPMGSRCASAGLGGVRIEDEVWVLDAGLPGLHALQLVRRDAHGPNLESLRAQVGQLTAATPLARIGLPSSVFISECDGSVLQFPAFAEAGGVVLQCCSNSTGALRFCAATPAQITALAESIVRDMKLFWKRRRRIAADAKDLRAYAHAKLQERGDPGTAVRAVAVELTWQHEFDHFDYYVEYDGLDEALRPGRVTDYVPAGTVAEGRYRATPWGVAGAAEELRELRDKGADGTVDELTAALLRAAPEGAAAILARLSCEPDTTVTFTTRNGPLYGLLFWRSGCIQSEICVQGWFDWAGHSLEISSDRLLSDQELLDLAGAPIREAFDLPIDFPGKIRRASQLSGGTLCLNVDWETLLVNTRTGRVL